MTSTTDIANRMLTAIGTRSTIASLVEDSNVAIQCNIILQPLRRQLLRMAPWNCATYYANLSVICAAPGTPENPTTGTTVWERGIPPPPWAYEYAYPSNCLKPLWIVPQFATGFSGGVPVTTAVTGGAPQFWNGPPVAYKVATDTIGPNGTPTNNGAPTKVILTNQEQAILAYIFDLQDPNVMDELFQQAWVAAGAGQLVMALTGDKKLANLKVTEANGYIQTARAADGNEGLTINDITPDFIRIRGINFVDGEQWGPYNYNYDWGGFLNAYA